MPKFPTYHGELPECLNPLNPRHYFLLIYWVFFRPTALKCYLYQANPELYHLNMPRNVQDAWHIPAYRNLYIMIPILSVCLSICLWLPFMLLISWIEKLPINWFQWTIGIMESAILGLLGGLVSGTILCIASGMVMGVMFGLLVGLMGVIGLSAWIGTAAGLGFSMESGALVGVISGITSLGITSVILVFSKKVTIKSGVKIGFTVGFIIAMGSALFFNSKYGVKVDGVFGTAFGVVGGVGCGVVLGVGAGLGAGLRSSIGTIILGIILVIITGISFDMTTALVTCIGVLRLIFYPFEFVLALCSRFSGVAHPLKWDELTVLPLPWTQRLLFQQLQQDEKEGLRFLTSMGRNSFRQAAVQNSLYHYLHTHSHPLHFFYALFSNSDLKEYIVAPTNSQNWHKNSITNSFFLAKLSLQFIELKKGSFSSIYCDRFIWMIMYPFREHRHSSLTLFFKMLHDQLEENIAETRDSNLSSYAKIYNKLSAYPGGEEISQTFDALATFLSYQTLATLPSATVISPNLRFDDPIRPAVITALQRLGAVGAEIQTYQDSTSRANQMAALARATDMLKALREYVAAEVITPEQVILQQIIRQWQDLLISAGGELGRAEVAGPVMNPFVVGNPVQGSLFVGREDVLRRLEELWRGEGQKPSIVLYGHRRMGKSSILHNLGARFGQEAVIIDFNMQRAGMVASTGELLYNLALSIYDGLEANVRSLPAAAGFDLQEPVEERFLAHNPSIAFDRFLKQVDQIRQGKRLIIAIDEFELIEQKIKEGKLDPYLLDFCRGLIQSYAWFVIVFAGLHTLQEMARNYWNPLFGSVTGLMVSFLNDKAAQRLITQPTADFALDYDQDAIAEIIRLTHGQPYLIQLICHSLVSRFNQQTFEEGVERERRFTLADLHAVIHSPEFFRDGDAYFTGIWQQEQGAGIETQHRILQTLAQSETGLTENELAEQGQFAAEPVQEALEVLARHDVVTQIGHVWRFNVELMRRWIVRKEHVFR